MVDLLFPLTLAILLTVSLTTRAAQIDEFVDIHFASTTTIEKPADSFTFMILRDGNLPIALDLEVRPLQGTFSVEYDNQLRIRYDDSQVKQGSPKVDADLDWLFRSGSFGNARLRQGFLLIPVIEIDFDALFGDLDWSAVADSLPMPADGSILRQPVFAAEDIELKIFDSRSLDGLAVNSVLLGDPIDPFADTFELADSTSFHTSFIPYPCLRVDLDISTRLDFKYTMKNTAVCVRYSSDPADDECWTATDSTHCIDAYGTVRIPVRVGCEEVRHKVVPFCPVTATGELALQVQLTVDINGYSIAYECTDLPGLDQPETSVGTTSPVDTLLFSQTMALVALVQFFLLGLVFVVAIRRSAVL